MLGTLTSVWQYLGNDAATSFAFNAKVLLASHLQVTRTTAAGVNTVLTYAVDYSVTGLGLDGGGSITYPLSGAPLATGDRITLERLLPLTQPTDLRNQGGFFPQTHEDVFDRLTMISQQLDAALDRTYARAATSVATNSTVFPDPTANYLIGWNSAGDALENKTGISGLTIVSAFMATLLDDSTAANALTTLGFSTLGQNLRDDTTLAGFLTTLGISAGVQSLLDDASLAAMLATLDAGRSALVQALLASATIDAVQTALGVASKNHVVNGDFGVWQLGTTISATLPSANANDDDHYGPDQWILLSETTSNAVEARKETTIVPTGARTALALKFLGTTSKAGMLMSLSNERSKELAGQTVSLQFKARVDAAIGAFSLNKIRAAVLAWSGTVDAITSDPINAWSAEDVNPTLVTNWAYANTPAALASLNGTSFQTFKIEGIAIPSNATNVALFIWIDDKSYSANGILYLGDVALNVGATASRYEHRPLADELRACQETFCKTHELETAPIDRAGTGSDVLAGSLRSGGIVANVAGFGAARWRFPVLMRATPSITTLCPTTAGTATDWAALDASAAIGAVVVDTTRLSTTIETPATGATHAYRIHALADARL